MTVSHSFKIFPAVFTLSILSPTSLAQTPPDEFGESGTCGAIEISPPSDRSLHFGTVNLGFPSSKTVTLKNTGRDVMTLQDITVSGEAFTRGLASSEECLLSQVLSPAQACQIAITFAPTTVGNKEGLLQVTSRASNAPYIVNLKGKAQGLTVDCLDENVTLESVASGPWEQKNTWSPNRPPNPSDLVKINPGHTVEGGYVKAQCIIVDRGGSLTGKKELLKVEAGEIYNRGNLLGKAGEDGQCQGSAVSAYQHATAGGDVVLKVMRLTNDGKIQGGRGGHDITHGTNCPSGQNIEAHGGNGGSVNIDASATVTNNGTIGSEGDSVYGQIVSSSGNNGGVGSNNANSFNCSRSGSSQLGSGYNYGQAWGGSGGKTVVKATVRVVNMGRMSSGYGGDARVWSDCNQAHYGTAGNLVVTSPLLDNKGTISAGQSGEAFVEPDIFLSGPAMRLEDSKHITLFGGDEWRLSLSNLSEDALRASESITLAVGKGGVIDLRGNSARIINAGKQVEIFADNILLDAGVRLQDLATAPNIQLHPSKILHAFDLSVLGIPPTMEVMLLNAGPVGDTYTIESSPPLEGFPTDVLLESFQQTSLPLTIPATAGFIEFKATSQNTQITKTVTVGAQDSPPPPPPPVPVTIPPAVACPPTGTINFVCDNHGRTITDATLGASAIVSGGTLAGTIQNNGFVSQVTLQSNATLTGGILSGYITNHGTVADFEFAGAAITGGTVAGTVVNTSKVGGTLIDVMFAPKAHLIGGRLQGKIQGDPCAPASLDNVRVLAGSHLFGVTPGENVVLEQDVAVEAGECQP